MKRINLIKYGLAALTASTALIGGGGTAQAPAKQPNILFIMGDDIGYFQPSLPPRHHGRGNAEH